MMKITLSLIVATLISSGLMLMCLLISKKMKFEREKMSPFECGFDPKSSARMPFSIQFFLIAVLFLIFDIEIAIILPMIITLKTSKVTMWVLTVTIFMITLIFGLFYEWKSNMLEWTK
uniref:NADH-ubiquinone oxidoreductase chain 3 n=2 Tax=Berytidae TaxID=236388 RepID=B7SMQ0_9HEMI|nr:NADH dehydrogenase subunit 3 [Yemmalysus parallelus]ABZ02144.1 NADH dehydrogenase subunit 3 [Yemmalysus parallelus]UPL65500.1 NADH dehydrogenase subunit 3 [Metatropis brevirostris]